MSKRFMRRDCMRHYKLGKSRKKLRVWRKAKGIHNKMRLRRAGYPAIPNVGYKTARKDSGKISGLVPALVHNLKELSLLGKNSIAIIARVGARKKIDILKKADELKIKVLNSNVKGGAK